jgi:hypothetical protein
LNRDPIEEKGGHNLFVFTRNAPIDLVDMLGQAAAAVAVPSYPGCGTQSQNIENDLSDACSKVNDPAFQECFRSSMGNNEGMIQRLLDFCNIPSTRPRISCAPRSDPDCGGAFCATTTAGGDDHPSIKICLDSNGQLQCTDSGCTMLHELTHAAGAVRGDRDATQEAECCGGCPIKRKH